MLGIKKLVNDDMNKSKNMKCNVTHRDYSAKLVSKVVRHNLSK